MTVKKDNVIGFAMQLDVTDLKAGLQETKKAITTANKQFNASVAGMDNWQDTIEGVSAKLNHLDTVLLNQKKNLAGYEKELENTKEEYGENSEQVRRLQDKILDCQTAIGKTEKAQRKYTAQLEKVQSEHVSTIEDVDELESTLKELATQLGKDKKAVADYEDALEKAKAEHGNASDEVNKLVNELNKAKRAVSNTESAQKAYESQLEKVQSESKKTTTSTKSMTGALKDADSATIELKGGFTVLKGVMANLASNVITNLVSGLKSVVAESREFRSEMSFLQATAEKTGASFDQAQDKVKEVYAVLGETDSAVEGMNNLMTAGFDGDALDKITDQLIGASIQWHDTLKFEGLADGLQETLATGKAVGPFVELLERGGMVAEDFDEGLAKCKTDAEKQNYVLQKLSKLGLAEVTQGYKETNKSLVEGAEAQFEYEQSMAQVGEKVEPVLTTIKKGVVDLIGAFLELTKGSDMESLKVAIEGAFRWFIEEVVPIIKSTIQFVIDNKDLILALIAGVGAGFAAWKVTSILTGVVNGIKSAIIATKAWMVATEGMTVAQRLLNLAQKANVIGIVITAIVALVAVFVTLWKKCDWFREFWIDLWDKIKSVASKVWSAIKKYFVDAWDAIKKVWNVAVTWFKNIWEGIKKVFMTVVTFYATVYGNAWKAVKKVWEVAVSWFKNIWNGIKKVFSSVGSTIGGYFKNAWSNVKSAWSSVTSFFSGIVTKVKNAFKGIKDKFKSIGKDMMNGIKEGITSKLEAVKEAATNVVKGAKDKIKSFLGINSPSRVMRDEVGKMMGEGVGVGLLDSTKSVMKDATKFTDSVINGISSKVSNINVGVKTNVPTMQSVPAQHITKVTNYSQTINSPKALTRKEIYMKTKNLLSWTEGQ